VKKTRQNKEIEPPFRFYRNGKGSTACLAKGIHHAQTITLQCQRQSAVEFLAALFHEASKQQDPPLGSDEK
jgi:hypothetical protein